MKLLELSMPWWEFVLRGAGVYLGLLLLIRLTGKRAFGEMTAFDIVVLILVGGTLRTAIVGDDKSLAGAFLGVLAILALNKLLGFACARCPRIDRLVEGHASLIARGGALLPGALRRHDLSEAAFRRALRAHGLRDVGDVVEARLEANGRISVVKAPK